MSRVQGFVLGSMFRIQGQELRARNPEFSVWGFTL